MTDERAPIEVRTAPIDAVDYPARTINVRAVPYDEVAEVDVGGRIVEESFAPGAFGSVDKRFANQRQMVNLEHNPTDWVGRVVAVYPNEPAGLRAELKIRRGPSFDQVLDDAADGMYAVSVGFRSAPADQEWDQQRRRRRIRRAFLDHVALTTNPAYAGAEVLAVRSVPAVSTSTTPNLDRILAERARAAYHFDV